MDQTVSPEPQGQMEPQAPLASPGAPQSPVYPPPPESYAPPAQTQVALMEAPQRPAPLTTLPPEEPRKRNPFWKAIKWPLRKLLLGIYLLLEVMRKHKREATVVGVLLLALVITGGVVYQATRPAPPPVTVERSSMPALPASVILYLHGRQHFNAAELWSAYDSTARSQLQTTEAQLQTSLNQEKSAGLSIDRYVYSGGYQSPDGTSHYTIEVYASQQGQTGVFTWYFDVGTNGLITQRLDMTPQ